MTLDGNNYDTYKTLWKMNTTDTTQNPLNLSNEEP